MTRDRTDDRLDREVMFLSDTIAANKELLHGEIVALDRLMTSLRVRDQEALVKAAETVEDRLNKMNEFRGALSDAQAVMMPRAEAKLLIDGVVARVEVMQGSVTALSQTLVGLRAALQGQDTGHEEEQRRTDRLRTLIFEASHGHHRGHQLVCGTPEAESNGDPDTHRHDNDCESSVSKPSKEEVDNVLAETNAALTNLTKSIESMKKMLAESFENHEGH